MFAYLTIYPMWVEFRVDDGRYGSSPRGDFGSLLDMLLATGVELLQVRVENEDD